MSAAVSIADPEDPRIEPYRAIKERDLVGREGRFIAEGEVVLRVLAQQRNFAIESLLLAENRLDALGDLIASLPPQVPVYVANRAVMDSIVGFPIHRGILALARRPVPPPAGDLLASVPADALAIGLVGLANHDNIGGIFRNAAAFGVSAVLLDRTCCDPLYRKAIRVSVGGVLVVPFTIASDPQDMISTFEARGFEVLSLSPAGVDRLSSVRPSGRIAVMLGAEGPGLPNAILARTKTVSIPMSGGFDSLNVATTSGIVLHHLAEQRRFLSGS